MREAEHLDDCYRMLRQYCAGVEPEYRYYSWEHARRLRLLAQWRRGWASGMLCLEANEIETWILQIVYAKIKPHILTGQS